jgi:endonuclease/exonuclease/phosphatase (EEP) superfamily protein YafD
MKRPVRMQRPRRTSHFRATNPVLTRLVSLAIGCVFCACSQSPKKDPQHATRALGELTIATYNVNFGLAGEPKTLAAVGTTGADIVVLQETTPAWEQAIRKTWARRYPHIAFRHSAKWPAGGMAFLSRYPLSMLRISPSAVGFFFAWSAVVETPFGKLQLVNLHLKPPVSNSGSYVSGYFTTGKDRRAEMQLHARLLDPKMPTVVLGDFNEARGGGLSLLEKRGYRDVLAGRADNTWRWKVGPFSLREQLDHIVYQPQRLECVETRVLERGRSDHLPVVARFRVLAVR